MWIQDAMDTVRQRIRNCGITARQALLRAAGSSDPVQALRPQAHTPVLGHEASYPALHYSCSRAWMDNGGPHPSPSAGCASMMPSRKHSLASSVRAIAAATAAAKGARERRDQVRDALSATSKRRAMPPTGLSGNTIPPIPRTGWWRVSLRRAGPHAAEVEGKIAMHDAATPAPLADPASLGVLASNLKTVWDAPTTDARLKKRIVPTLLHEVVADLDDAASEIVLIVHWVGAPTASCPSPSAGADSATAPLPISFKPCVNWY